MREPMKHLAVLLLATSLAACAGKPVALTTHFNPADVAWAVGNGPNGVSGQAFLRQQGGGVVTCAGEEVSLVPASPYSTERITARYGSSTSGSAGALFGNRLPTAEPGYESSFRRTHCDAQGNFSFPGLPDGDYYLVTKVVWTVGSNIFPEGGQLMQKVSLRGGQQPKVVLTR